MNILTRIFMYIYIFGPSSRGVNTLSAKEWFVKMHKNNRKDSNHSKLEKRRAHRAGYMPDFVDKYGWDYEGHRVSEREYLYLQPINGLYRKWIESNEVAEEIFRPFSHIINTRAEVKPDSRRLRIIVVNDAGYYPEITEAYFPAEEKAGSSVRVNPETGEYEGESIDCWQEIADSVKKMARYTPQLAFFGLDLQLDGEDFTIVNFMNYPEYPDFPFGERTVAFLKEKEAERRKVARDIKFRLANAEKRIRWKTRQNFTALFYPKEMMPYLGMRWIKEVVKDFFSKSDANLKTKLWAYRHGFLSYRIGQYGITEKNYPQHISDFEYKWLRHINGEYRKLFDDKITIKYIMRDFKECFPDYFYHIKSKNGENIIIPLMDCPEGYEDNFEDIIRLAKEKKELALKPETGSHGNGFYRLTWDGEKFYLNFKESTEDDIKKILRDPVNQYLITEYINNNEQFKKIYSGAVNTIRMIVFKYDGVTPEIGNVYMRFGSSATGTVDNMGAGGIFVQVDPETGWYHSAKIIRSNCIEDCPRHPDTDVLIEGYIPHYEKVRQIVLDIAASATEMEYFGFDVAVTEDGVKFPEINRFPDYPKIEKLSPRTMEYLLKKLDEKKQRCGYDKKPCRKIVHLPKR